METTVATVKSGTGDSAASTESSVDTMDTGGVGGPCDIPDEKYLAAEEVYALYSNECPGILYLNVVDEQFYTLGHIPGSVEIPWTALAARLDEVSADQTILVYCRKGVRSEAAYDVLVEAGYPSLHVLTDGLEAWIAAGYETVPIQ